MNTRNFILSVWVRKIKVFFFKFFNLVTEAIKGLCYIVSNEVKRIKEPNMCTRVLIFLISNASKLSNLSYFFKVVKRRKKYVTL